MPIDHLVKGVDTLITAIDKINQLIDFCNSIQKCGTGSYMIWVGDGTVPPKPIEVVTNNVGGTTP
jgi:hypothetical protein